MKAFIPVLLAVIFLSCKKDNNTTNNVVPDTYYLTCDIDGVPTTFNSDLFYHPEWGAYKAVTINGLTSLSATAPTMGWVIINNPSHDSIVAQTYSDAMTNFEVLASYATDNSSSTQYEAGTTLYHNAQTQSVTIINHFNVVITSINNQVAKGTFSGDFYLNADPHGSIKHITNGQFSAPIVL